MTTNKSKSTKKTNKQKISNVRKKVVVQEEKQSNTALTLAGIILLIIIAIVIFGLTYAYFTANIKDEKISGDDVEVHTANLLVRYIDGASNMELDAKIEPGDKIIKEFSIKNEGNDTGYYTIILDKYQNHFDRICNAESIDSDLDFSLIRLDKDGNEVSKIMGTLPCANEYSTFILAKNESVELKKDENENIISDTNYYRLEINYENLVDEDQSDDMGSLFEARINIIESEDEMRTAQ